MAEKPTVPVPRCTPPDYTEQLKKAWQRVGELVNDRDDADEVRDDDGPSQKDKKRSQGK